MAIQYVGGQTASITVVSPTTQTITYSLTGGLASVPAAGDLVIVGYGEAAGGDAALSGRISTSGYSLITELYSNDSQDSNLAVFRKFMGGTPDSNISVIGSTSTNSAVTVNIQVWRGVDTTTPLDPTTTTATGINTGYANPAAITPAATDNVIALFANTATSNNDSSTYSTASTSYMTGFRQVARAGNSYRSIGGSGYVTGQSAGVSYDPAAWVVSSDSVGYSWCAATLALRPAGDDVTVAPDVGSVTVSGLAPVVGAAATASIPVGSISVSGIAPSVTAGAMIEPAVGNVSVDGLAPAITVGSTVIVEPGPGSVTVDGIAPLVAANVTVSPNVGALAVSGLAPSVSAAVLAAPGLGSIVVLGIAPSVDTGIVENGRRPKIVAAVYPGKLMAL